MFRACVSCFEDDQDTWPQDFTPPLLVCGLDNAGKTTIINSFPSEETVPVPTVGITRHTVTVGGRKIQLYDVGGVPEIWASYYYGVYGVLFIVDSTDMSRIIEVQETLNEMLENDYLQGKPMIIFANKQDDSNALTALQLSKKLKLYTINPSVSELTLLDCSATKDPVDKSIENGMLGIIEHIGSNYDVLFSKVSKGLAEYQELKELQERVRKARVRAAEDWEQDEAEKEEGQ